MYQLTWSELDQSVVVIIGAIDPTRFVLGERYTDEEKQIYKARKAIQTPEQNLRELFDENFQSKWKATELYEWFESNCPGYKVRRTRIEENACVEFADLKHAMLFKLTWGGV